MAGAFIIHDFHSGKRTVKGEPNPDLSKWETVTVILPEYVDEILGVKTLTERKEMLRKLRDQGSLITSENPKVERLTHTVRGDDGKRFRAYVFPFPDPGYIPHAVDKIRHPEKYRR